MSTIKTIPLSTWQFLNVCKRKLGSAVLTKLFKVGLRQINRWSCDPDFSESSQQNPVDKYEELLRRCMDIGIVDIARASVDRQARIVECHLSCEVVNPDKDDLAEELLDDLPVIADFHQAVLRGDPLEVVREKYRLAKSELDEDFEAYNIKMEGGSR